MPKRTVPDVTGSSAIVGSGSYSLSCGWMGHRVASRSPVISRLGAAGGDFGRAVPTGKLDEVLVQFEPDAVVAIDAW